MGGGRPVKHLLSKIVFFPAGALIFFQIGWMMLLGRPGRPQPDAQHTEAIHWRGGGVTYLTPREKLADDLSFWGGFCGICLAVSLEAGLDAVDRRRERRGLPKLRI